MSTPVIGIIMGSQSDLKVMKEAAEFLDERPGRVAAAVVHKNHLEGELFPLGDGEYLRQERAEGFFFVVDGDDDGDHARLRAASRPERSASSIELYSHFP